MRTPRNKNNSNNFSRRGERERGTKQERQTFTDKCMSATNNFDKRESSEKQREPSFLDISSRTTFPKELQLGRISKQFTTHVDVFSQNFPKTRFGKIVFEY